MSFDIKRVEYYNTTVADHAGEASKLLALFAGVGVSLLAFKAVPLEPGRTRFTLFPNDGLKMTAGAKRAGLELDGPHSALLIQGDDESGALADIYEKLSQADIHMNRVGSPISREVMASFSTLSRKTAKKLWLLWRCKGSTQMLLAGAQNQEILRQSRETLDSVTYNFLAHPMAVFV